jgi:signal transduction histidine kinase
VELIAGVVSATIALYAFVGFFFVAVRIRRPEENEYGVFGALCFALAAEAGARVAGLHAATPEEVLSAARLGCVALIASFVLLCHFAFEYARLKSRNRAVIVPYAVGAVFEVLNARGLLHDAARLTDGRGGEGAVLGRAPINALGLSMYGFGVVVVIAVLVILARAYLAGRREAITVVVGATVVLATLINDLGFAAGKFATTYLVEVGFVALLAGVASTLVSRYAIGARELGRRTGELRTRTRELRRSYEELRAAQEELVRKEQLAVVGELAAVIAHEVRNPLAIIANAVAGLRKQSLTREDHATLLSILDEETSRLNRLVSDLLRYARPVNVQRQNISLRDLIERGLSLAQNRKALNVELKVEAPELRLWGDSNLLRQVFDNLIDNAVQAMGYGGTLTVRIRAMQYEGDDGLAVDIIDTGEGMDTMVRSRAKDPFFTTRPSGTGLGLAIVDRIVDAHGGRFFIESRSGEGTTATVFLPSGTPSEPPPPRSRPKSSKGSPVSPASPSSPPSYPPSASPSPSSPPSAASLAPTVPDARLPRSSSS